MGALFASNSLLDKSSDDVVEDGLLTAKDKTTIMIMGVDERDDDVGRSDTLMVATLDPKKDHAALMSIPRDTRVKIKGHGWDKINAAYAYGSAKGGPEAHTAHRRGLPRRQHGSLRRHQHPGVPEDH